MSNVNQSSRSILSVIVRIFVFLLALYLAYIILRPLLSILLGIGFWVIKVFVFIAVALLVIHLFLKLLFGVDLFYSVFGRRSWPF